MKNEIKFEDLLGKTLTFVQNVDDEKLILKTENEEYCLTHVQDCCEQVYIEDICGNLEDLVNSPILLAEESCSNENPEGILVEYPDESFTWTFYKLSTLKGSVTIRWYGTSNGYYSESVDFFKV